MTILAEPAMRILVGFAGACGLVLLVEPLAVPRRIASKVAATQDGFSPMIARLGTIFLIFAFFFAISWRPVYAFAATVSFFMIFTAISRGKYRFVREPLVFADIALLPILLRHKDLFYANFIGIVFWVGSLLYVFGASAIFYYFEPSVLPASGSSSWMLFAMLVALAPWVALFVPSARQVAGHSAASLLGSAEPLRSTLRFGTFGYVLLHFLAWMSFSPSERNAARAAALATFEGSQAAPVVLIWQSESFYDMRRAGVTDLALPALDALRCRAARWGHFQSVFEGGYTMRTEFSTIAGIAPAQLGPDAYFPYLRPQSYAPFAWPTLFREAGWSTTFIHPYDRQFFRRHKAIPALGFDRVLMLDDFQARPGRGPYVTDRELADRVLEICAADPGRPQFIFVASMENHGPWKPDRLGGQDKATAIYLNILKRTDAAIGDLFAALDHLDRPVWAAFYGDHAPLLDGFPDGFPDPRTDYVVIPSGTARKSGEPVVADTQAWTLVDDLVGAAAAASAPRPAMSDR